MDFLMRCSTRPLHCKGEKGLGETRGVIEVEARLAILFDMISTLGILEIHARHAVNSSTERAEGPVDQINQN